MTEPDGHIEIVDIAHDAIEPNPTNPNRMDDAVMKALKEDIEKRGNVRPLLVRPIGNLAGEVKMHVAECPMTKPDPTQQYTCICQHYENDPKTVPEGGITHRLIDGEHRWRVLGELGAETVPCVVVDRSETDAQIQTITMNKLRGRFVPIKLARLLADLATRIEPAEMQKRLAMDKSEMKNLLDLGDFLEPAPPKIDKEPSEPKPPGREVVVVATPEQWEKITRLTSMDEDEQAEMILEAARA